MKLAYLAPFAFLLACSSSESEAPKPPCNEDPWQCPAGQTCWPKDTTPTFACLNSAAGKAKGDSCSNIVGTPTCGDGMACFMAAGETTGKCVTYCDTTTAGRGCAAGETCTTAMLVGSSAKFHICVGTSTPTTDAGTDTGSSDTGSTDTGGAADSGSDSSASDAAEAG